jgi:hypothetical protein
MIQILSHRGFWKLPEEKNTSLSLSRSAECGYGTETDLRDYNGTVVISHDCALETSLSLDSLLTPFNDTGLTLALNIKSDGLAPLIAKSLSRYKEIKYFVFDMSLPDQVKYLDLGMTVFTGMSDINMHPPLLDHSAGVWLDSFNGDWFGPGLIEGLASKDKFVCVVSPELHRRDHLWQWQMIRDANLHINPRVLLCTDFPDLARNYFFGANND